MLAHRKLIRVTAPHFVAGVEFKNGRCVRAAPILKWAKGMTFNELFAKCKEKKWIATVVSNGSSVNLETL